MSSDVFDRVEKLLQEYTKTASSDSPTLIGEEYDKGKHVKPEKDEFLAAVESLLKEHYPQGPDSVDEPDDDPQAQVDSVYSSAPNPEVADEDRKLDAETTGPEGGEKVLKEKIASLSDEQLLKKYASAVNGILEELATYNPAYLDHVNNPLLKAASFVARVQAQAEFDAGLVAGYLNSITKRAADETTPPAEVDAGAGDAVADIQQQAAVDPEAALKFLKDIGISDDDLVEILAEIVKEHPDAVQAIVDSSNNPDLKALAAGEPETIRNVLKSNPDLAQAVKEVLNKIEPGAADSVDALLRESEAAPEKEDQATATANDVVDEVTEKAGGEDEVEDEEAYEDAEDEDSELAPEDTEDEDAVDAVKASSFQHLKALDRILQEMNLTPDDIVLLTRGGAKEKEAVKVANAVRTYRQRYKRVLNKAADVQPPSELRSFLQQYLYELLNS